LVAAFKSTLEEALHADVLLHVIDASHPMAEEQAKATFDVLKELKAEDKPMITLLNKIDVEGKKPAFGRLRLQYVKTVPVSAKTGEGFDRLTEKIEEVLQETRTKMHLKIPQKQYDAVSLVLREGKVLAQEYEENAVLLEVEIPAYLTRRLKEYEI